MPPPSSEPIQKLRVFVAVVVGSLGVILAVNVDIHDRTTSFSEGAGTPLRAGLERLAANPTCAMTMEPGPDSERRMRHVNATIVGRADVIALGQSDADHIPRSFFKADARFYNDFISNSYFVLEYEAFLDLVKAHGPPSLVLFDVRSGFILRAADEAEWDDPPNSAVWWGFPPFHSGEAKPLPWYRDIPSLLSLAQTELTLTWFSHQLPQKMAPRPDGAETDNGDPFRCVPLTEATGMYRWMADGSRVYEGEVNGVVKAPKEIHVTEAIGDRHVNLHRVKVLEWVIARIRAEGSKILMYSPPLSPRSYDDARQKAAIVASGVALREVAVHTGVDYCDLTFDADRVGCVAGDFADELHISRHCDQRVVRELTQGCAPRTGALLRSKLAPATLE